MHAADRNCQVEPVERHLSTPPGRVGLAQTGRFDDKLRHWPPARLVAHTSWSAGSSAGPASAVIMVGSTAHAACRAIPSACWSGHHDQLREGGEGRRPADQPAVDQAVTPACGAASGTNSPLSPIRPVAACSQPPLPSGTPIVTDPSGSIWVT